MEIRQKLASGIDTYWTPWMSMNFLQDHHLIPGFVLLESIHQTDYGAYEHLLYAADGSVVSCNTYEVLPMELNILSSFDINAFYVGKSYGLPPAHTYVGGGLVSSVAYREEKSWTEPTDFDDAIDDLNDQLSSRRNYSKHLHKNEQPFYEEVMNIDEEERIFKEEIFRLKNEA